MSIQPMAERNLLGPRAWLGQLRSRPGRANIRYELTRILRGEPSLPAPVARAVVICHGNICRSPFAAALLARGCPAIEIRSAGLAASGGDPAQPGALRVALEYEVDLATHRSTPMDDTLADWADLIIGMEGHHVEAVASRWPAAARKAFVLGDFLPRAPHLIPDPWGLPDAVFRRTFDRIEAATVRLVDRIGRRERAAC